MFTKEQILEIANLANDGEIIPTFAFHGSNLQQPTDEDIEWARKMCKDLYPDWQ